MNNQSHNYYVVVVGVIIPPSDKYGSLMKHYNWKYLDKLFWEILIQRMFHCDNKVGLFNYLVIHVFA